VTRAHTKPYHNLPSNKIDTYPSWAISSGTFFPWMAMIILIVSLLWGYWPTVHNLMREWRHNEDYSVGQLVPFIAMYFIWMKRKILSNYQLIPCWWGIGIVLLAQAVRVYGLIFLYESAERYSLVLTIVGITLLVTGRHIFYQLRWILLFLFLMVPFPGRIHNMISGPLQTMATICSTYTLELLGIYVIREGHIIIVNDNIPLAVVEACSGLRMLTAFIVVSAVFAYIVDRPKWQKFILLISCIPVAILCNQIRLTVTALLFMQFDSHVADRFFHDFAGWTMMPLAVVALVGELWIMSKLVIRENSNAKDENIL